MARPRTVDADGRERLLGAAWQLLVDEGGRIERISVARVCAAAGCSAPTLYHHFPDLTALLAAAGRRAFDDWVQAIEPRVSDESDPRRRLSLRGHAYVEWALQHPRAYQAMFPGVPRPDKAPQDPGPAFTGLREDVAQALGAASDDPRVLPVALAHWAAAHGIASLALASSAVPPAVWVATLDHLTTALSTRLEPDGGRSSASQRQKPE